MIFHIDKVARVLYDSNMYKRHIFVIISVLCVLALLACGLFACNKVGEKTDPTAGRVTPVGTAMNTVYGAMVASDGSKGDVKKYTLLFNGSYTVGETIYDFDFGGAFDITQNNRDNDLFSQMHFEVKQGGVEVFLLYYTEGVLYLDFPPYARRAKISDFNLAEVVYAIHRQKENGVIKDVADTLPALASRVFDGCRCYSENGAERYRFTLSYKSLFSAFSSFVNSWDAGFNSGELLAALHLNEASIASLSEESAATYLDFVVKDGVFLSAKAVSEGKGSIALDSFSLTSGAADMTLPDALSTFTEFDFKNFALSGTVYLKAESASGGKNLRYGVSLSRDFDSVSYPFTYDFKSHYVAGSGLEFDLSLTDMNGKSSRFAVRGEYLFADLSAYGVQKFKMKTADLWDKLGVTGFREVDEYTFKDEMHLISLLAAARNQEGDLVTYSLGSDFFDLLSKKLGFAGLFGVSGLTLGWNKANDRLQDLRASLEIGAVSLSLQASSFTFGTPVTLPQLDQTQYADLASRESTHLSAKGTLTANTAFSTDGAFLSALLSSLSGEELIFEEKSSIGYDADFVFGETGALRRVKVDLYLSGGVLTLYYTEETKDSFYLIYPERAGVRNVRTLSIAEGLLSAFNEALDASGSIAGNKMLLAFKERSFTIGAYAPMLSYLEEKLSLLYPDLSFALLKSLDFSHFELKVTADALTGKLVFDSDNNVILTATEYAVTFGDDVGVASIVAETPEKVSLFANNDMPTTALVTFEDDNRKYTLSLLDYLSGDRIWTYDDKPKIATGTEPTERTVTASATLLGKTVTAPLKVDVSPAASSVLSGSALYGGKYNVNKRVFTFNIYNDTAPQTVLDSFEYITVTVGSTEYVKKTTWDLSSFAIAPFYSPKETTRVRDFTVKPLVETYFGNKIDLGSDEKVSAFTLHVNGYPAAYVDYSKTFVAYDPAHLDFTDEKVYSDVLTVYHVIPGKENETDVNKKIAFDDPIEVYHVEWDLEALRELKADKNGAIYNYTTKKDKPDTVKVNIYDFTGYSVELRVNVFFEAREVKTVTFGSLPDGVTFDAQRQEFTFDVLKVRGLSVTAIDKVLPRSLIANDETENAFTVENIKWEFDPVDNVLNASGKTGTLSLVIGDEISGYQHKTFSYKFTSVQITKTALIAEDGTTVIAHKDQDIYAYSLTDLSAYTYRYPAYLRATYAVGEGEENELIPANWKSDKPYSEQDLWKGGTYLLTGALGSETVTLSLTFKRQDFNVKKTYRFGTDAEKCTISGDRELPLSMHEGHLCLTYSVLSALDGTSGLNYTKTEDYPAEMEIAFDGVNYVKTSVLWDLSAFKKKTDMIGIGGIVTVTAVAKGQEIPVFVYVEPAVSKGDGVYVDEGRTSETLTFRLMTPSDDGSGFTVTDPRDPANYPKKLYITSGLTGAEYEVNVLSWSGIEEVTRLFTTELNSGKAPNEIKGERVIKARIGNDTVGYKDDVVIPVAIVDSQVLEITLSGLPFAAGSDQTGGTTSYAVTVHDEAGETDTFAYTLSVDVNPYYVDPTSLASYPAYVNFKLDGKLVRAKANWDLSRIPANAAVDSKTATYLVYAMVDLTDAFPNLLVPVAVNVLKREIVKVWINDSAQPNLDIDAYAEKPFGSDVVGDEVTLDVKVQFKGDAYKYPLKLKYSKAGVVLYYDGSGLYENVTVRVGNENGGYQEVAGYSIRVLSNIVSYVSLAVDEEGYTPVYLGDGVFFRTEYESLDSDKLVYSYQEVVDMGKDLPSAISVAFGMGGTPRTIYRYKTEDAPSAGVVFDWSRDENGYLGVVIWNPALDAKQQDGSVYNPTKQEIYNPTQTKYNKLNQGFAATFFDTSALWEETYRDAADAQGYITVNSILEQYRELVKTDKVESVYQRYFVTLDEDEAAEIGKNVRLDAGTYRFYVNVVDHSYYSGKVYKTFTIVPKNITDSIAFYVGGGKHTEESFATSYTGDAFEVTAAVNETYPVSVRLSVGLKEGDDPVVYRSSLFVTNVRYLPETATVTYYEFVASVAEEEINYVVDGTKTFRFTLNEIGYTEAERAKFDFNPTWHTSGSYFTELVTYDAESIVADDKLVNGYLIRYYLSKDDNVNDYYEGPFTAGESYYARLWVKVPNRIKIIIFDGNISAK